MKKIFLGCVTMILISGSLFSQELVLKSGDLDVQKRPKGKFTAYETGNGLLYKIGDKITIGVPSLNKRFSFITEGDGLLVPFTRLLASVVGQKVEIKKIEVVGSKKAGFYASLKCKGLRGLANYSIKFEKAISAGEVSSVRMTNDEALAELEKAKKKLNSKLITQKEYDKMKADLIMILVKGSPSPEELVLKSSDLGGQKRQKGKFTAYEATDGLLYKVGDQITLGVPSSNKRFAFITEGDGLLGSSTQLLASVVGQKTEIKKIDILGSKRKGFYASLKCKGLRGSSNYNIQLENAISIGEVKVSGIKSDEALVKLEKTEDEKVNASGIKSDEALVKLEKTEDEKVNASEIKSDEALVKLKKAKEKLDLELITQEEYNKIKADLIKYIK